MIRLKKLCLNLRVQLIKHHLHYEQQQTHQGNTTLSWPDYLQSIVDRFTEGEYNDYMSDLIHLTHEGTVGRLLPSFSGFCDTWSIFHHNTH